jgi:c-di-GMP-binding flagellar brake protein YcgR
MPAPSSKRPDNNEFHWTPDGIRQVEEPSRSPASGTPAPRAYDPAPNAESRRYPRIDLKVPILYRILTEEPNLASTGLHPDLPTRTDNISVTGAGLVLAEKLASGTLLALSIHLESKKKISAVAKVVWSQPTETPHHHLTGLEFVVVYRKASSHTEYMSPAALKNLLE